MENKKTRNTLQVVGFLVACSILVFVIAQLSDQLSWCNFLIRVLVSAFIAMFLFVIPNVETLKLDIPKGVSAVGAIGVFFILLYLPVECNDNYYAFNVRVVDSSSKKVVEGSILEVFGESIGDAIILEEYSNGNTIDGNYNITSDHHVTIRCTHPKYIIRDTTLVIDQLKNNITIFLEMQSLENGSKTYLDAAIDYSQYSFRSSVEATTANAKSIKDLYLHYNNKLFSRFQDLLGGEDISGITLLAAPGGYGKSFVVSDNMILSVDSSITAIEYEFPKEMVGSDANMKTDLRVELLEGDEIITLGELAYLEEFSVEDYFKDESLFDSNKKKVILFDGLDEIHPQSAELIISEIEKNYQKYPNTRFILLARPETFNGYFSNPSFTSDENINFIQLSEISYRSLGDLKLRVQNICEYLPGVCDDLNFDRLVSSCAELLSRNPELNEAFGNLRISKDFISYVATTLKSNQSLSSAKIKSYIIARIFEDEKLKHNRPSSLDRETFGYKLYFAMFHEVTKKYSGQINKDGSFMVLDNDIITFNFKGKEYSFFVRDLLDRSGFINMEPANTPAKLYAFNPKFAYNYFLMNK